MENFEIFHRIKMFMKDTRVQGSARWRSMWKEKHPIWRENLIQKQRRNCVQIQMKLIAGKYLIQQKHGNRLAKHKWLNIRYSMMIIIARQENAILLRKYKNREASSIQTEFWCPAWSVHWIFAIPVKVANIATTHRNYDIISIKFEWKVVQKCR